MKKVLLLCTGNSCRSQMAEGFLKYLGKDRIEVFSAGVNPTKINPLAVKVMEEARIDISVQKSKDIDALGDREFDYVVTLCDNAHESCPFFPARTRLLHRGLDDPPKLAEDANDEEEAMSHYRRVRDEIRVFVETLPEGFNEK